MSNPFSYVRPSPPQHIWSLRHPLPRPNLPPHPPSHPLPRPLPRTCMLEYSPHPLSQLPQPMA